jgi:hypothetical protein
MSGFGLSGIVSGCCQQRQQYSSWIMSAPCISALLSISGSYLFILAHTTIVVFLFESVVVTK